ncbi:hypothetical protein CGRA01v4_01913 [Colletotrichum graminicola]|nr:hypothetical protein CGRA01v4_01913 [Colletotrichum graminicola]
MWFLSFPPAVFWLASGAKGGQFSATARILELDCPGQRRGGREKEHQGRKGFPGCCVSLCGRFRRDR